MIADDLQEALAQWMTPDLAAYLNAIGSMFSEVELYSEDVEEDDGWLILFDVETVPAGALPWLGQFVGETLPAGLPEVAARERVKDQANMVRGTVASIVRVAQRHLTGERTVTVLERSGFEGADNPDRIVITTYASETPNPDLVLRDLRADAVPTDIEIQYATTTGPTWAQIDAANSSWAQVDAAVPSWSVVRNAAAGSTYTRTKPV